jgi:hypothetical protein
VPLPQGEVLNRQLAVTAEEKRGKNRTWWTKRVIIEAGLCLDQDRGSGGGTRKPKGKEAKND